MHEGRHQHPRRPWRPIPALGFQSPWTLRHTHDPIFAGPLVELRRQKPVPSLGGAVVACLICGVVAGDKLGERDTTWRAFRVDDSRRCEYYPHAGFGREMRGSDEDRKQQFGQEERSEAVGAHVGFVALDAGAADRAQADTRIVPEHVEAGFLGEEGRSAGGDRGEVAEVERKTLDVSRGCGVNGLNGLDCGGDFDGRAAGDVDCAAFGVEEFDELKPDARISASDDEDFAHERRDVLFGESWTWWEKLRDNSSHDYWDDR